MCACFNKLFLINFLGAFFGSHISWWKNEMWHVPLDSIFENLVSMAILLKILKFTQLHTLYIRRAGGSLSAELINIWLSGSNISTLYRRIYKWGDSNVKVTGEKEGYLKPVSFHWLSATWKLNTKIRTKRKQVNVITGAPSLIKRPFCLSPHQYSIITVS